MKVTIVRIFVFFKPKPKPVLPLFNRLDNGKFQCKKFSDQNVPNDRNMIDDWFGKR